MKKLIILSCGCIFFAAISTSFAIDLKRSKITQVVNDVEIISGADQSKKTAVVNDVFVMPDILRTGPGSRAELVASDETVTRVGANTVFSFDPANRTINLQQGSLLFHSPHGKGGGTIQTGSATASVLGTTIIVTTTLSGGLKVLDLEGNAEVKFLNGLHQSLNPGQMTFVLPGGNQLAPIIIFRLDNLTDKSLLVKGFNQPLASMPLIAQQIAKQIKLIQSGRLTDTGLTVGDNADADHVEALDLNTIQSAFNSSAVNLALRRDATINQPSLTSATIPVPPKHVFVGRPFLLPNNPFFAGISFNGFAARNIFLNTVNLNPLTVDLSPYADQSEFDMVAANDIDIEGSVTFSGFSPETSIYFFLVAGDQITIAPGSTVEADIGNFGLQAPGAFTLNGASLLNNSGNLAVVSGSDVTVENGSYVHAFGNVSFKSGGNLAVSGSTITGDSAFFGPSSGTLSFDSSTLNFSSVAIFNASQAVDISDSPITTDPDSGLVSITSKSQSVTITGTSIQAHYLTVNSGDGILLDGNGQTFAAHGDGSVATFTAKNEITLNNGDFTEFAALNLAAHTINLFNDSFSGIVGIASDDGEWYNVPVGEQGRLGSINNYGGNRYDGTPIVLQTGFTGTIPGTQMTLSALPK